jgi:hypothetical protein
MKKISFNWNSLFLIIGLLILLPLVVYWVKFGSLQLSNDFQDWVDFSTYLSPILVTAVTIVLAYLSWQSMELIKIKEKPLLVVENDQSLQVKNIGAGPAINIKIFFSIDFFIIPDVGDSLNFDQILGISGIRDNIEEIEKRGEFHYMVSSLNLMAEETLQIDWQNSVKKMVIVYSDVYERSYSLTYEDRKNMISDGDIVGIDHFGFKKKEKVFFTKSEDKEKYDQIFTVFEIRKLM